MSWKVRRSSVKCLEAVMSTRHDMLQDFYKTVSPALIARFKEREENVKADIFLAYMALLKQTRPMQGWLQSSDIMGKEDSSLTMLKSQVSRVCMLSTAEGGVYLELDRSTEMQLFIVVVGWANEKCSQTIAQEFYQYTSVIIPALLHKVPQVRRTLYYLF